MFLEHVHDLMNLFIFFFHINLVKGLCSLMTQFVCIMKSEWGLNLKFWTKCIIYLINVWVFFGLFFKYISKIHIYFNINTLYLYIYLKRKMKQLLLYSIVPSPSVYSHLSLKNKVIKIYECIWRFFLFFFFKNQMFINSINLAFGLNKKSINIYVNISCYNIYQQHLQFRFNIFFFFQQDLF